LSFDFAPLSYLSTFSFEKILLNQPRYPKGEREKKEKQESQDIPC
jgi:hypothetical protein